MPIQSAQKDFKSVSTGLSIKVESQNTPIEKKELSEHTSPIIRAEAFTFYYGSKIGVKDITMDINKNCVTAIIGPSGCGKSTFLRSMNRMNDLFLMLVLKVN